MSGNEEFNPNPNPNPDAVASAAEQVAAEHAAASANNDLQNEIAKLRGEVLEANDRALRATAELENFRKRARRELEDEKRYAAMPLLRDLLNVLDNLDRAIEAAEKSPSASSLLEGVKMVSFQLTTYLDQHQCRRIPAVGAEFNPHFHEAIAQEPSVEHPVGFVTRVARHGYQLHDRVVRPAQVLVSIGPPAPAQSGATAPGASGADTSATTGGAS